MEMPQYTERIQIASAASGIWEVIATPERWSGGLPRNAPALADRTKPASRNNHVYRTQIKEDVAARVIPSEPPTPLEEAQNGDLLPPRARLRADPPHRRG
jgi:hypothetical protein